MRNGRVMAVALVAVVLGVLVCWLLLPREATAPAPVPPVPAAVKPVPVVPVPVTPAPQPATPVAKPVAAPAAPVPVAAPAPAPAAVPLPAWQEQPEAEFVPEDTANVGHGVTVDLGNYRAGVGQEFQVVVKMEAPALETMALPLAFDPEVVEVVPNSGKPVGQGLRRGLECNVSNAKGMLLLLQMGKPGMKNVNALQNEPVAVFTMKGKRKGSTTLRIGGKTMIFANGRGERERFGLHGGNITIE